MRDRIHDVAAFDAGGALGPARKYLFGDGGAGTFDAWTVAVRRYGNGPVKAEPSWYFNSWSRTRARPRAPLPETPIPWGGVAGFDGKPCCWPPSDPWPCPYAGH